MRLSVRVIAVALLLLAWLSPTLAHEVRPAYLRIQQSGEQTFETMWRVPAKGELRLGIYLEMPQQCKVQGDILNWKDGATFVEQGTWSCPGGLIDSEVVIKGIDTMMTDALARVERLDGTTQIARLTPTDNSFTVTATESWGEVASTYLALGIKHILLGFDHLLFVLALLLLVPTTRMLVWTITSFTLAHSVTLAAATMGWVHMPQKPIEAVIALSILFVAMEIVHWKQGKAGHHPALAMAGCVHFRPAAWIWFCRRPDRNWPARTCHPAGPVVLQPGCGSGAIDVHCRCLAAVGRPQADDLARLGLAGACLRHRFPGGLLDDRPYHRIYLTIFRNCLTHLL